MRGENACFKAVPEANRSYRPLRLVFVMLGVFSCCFSYTNALASSSTCLMLGVFSNCAAFFISSIFCLSSSTRFLLCSDAPRSMSAIFLATNLRVLFGVNILVPGLLLKSWFSMRIWFRPGDITSDWGFANGID